MPAPSSTPAEIVPDAGAPAVTPAAKPTGYYLIAGESVHRNRLDPVAEKLRSAGFKPDIAGATKEVEVFRLVVASFADRKPAELRRAQVALRTRRAFIARDADSYCVCAGSLMSEESARKELKRLSSKGLAGVQIVRVRVPLKVWQVTAGRYTDAREAENSAQRLSQRGIEVKIVGTGN
jgi:cell division protein FtsN